MFTSGSMSRIEKRFPRTLHPSNSFFLFRAFIASVHLDHEDNHYRHSPSHRHCWPPACLAILDHCFSRVAILDHSLDHCSSRVAILDHSLDHYSSSANLAILVVLGCGSIAANLALVEICVHAFHDIDCEPFFRRFLWSQRVPQYLGFKGTQRWPSHCGLQSLALCQLPVLSLQVVHLVCENGLSHVWWHHRFLSVALLWQQVSPMDDVFLVSFSCFRGHGEENRWF